MLLSLIGGLARWAWWLPAVFATFGLMLDVFVLDPMRNARMVSLGLEAPDGGEAALAVVLAFALNYAAYGIGRGVRYLWSRRGLDAR